MGDKILIRCDSSHKIGTGHFMRCLALADAAQKRGWDVCFVMKSPSKNSILKIENSGHSYFSLTYENTHKKKLKYHLPHSDWLEVSQEVDAMATLLHLEKFKANWVVVDHYALDETWHKLIKQKCNNVMVIDDLADRTLECSLLLNQNLGATEVDYNGKVPSDCIYLLGPKYALLREEFSQLSKKSTTRRTSNSVQKILVTMGGVDATNHTLNVLSELEDSEYASDCEFIVILGSEYPHEVQLNEFVKSTCLTIKVFFDIQNMARIMVEADLCIGAAGSTSWERCCLGLPTLTFALAENQKKIALELQKADVALNSSLETVRDDFDNVLRQKNSKTINKLIENSTAVCDGFGALRVTDHLENKK